jgi:hypothetical protein
MARDAFFSSDAFVVVHDDWVRTSSRGGIVPLPAAVQRRVDDEATAWARAYPDPLVADWVLAVAALVLAGLAVLGLVLPLAAVPLLVVAAVLCLGVAWGAAATVPAPPPLDDLRSALRAAAYRAVLARRVAESTAAPGPRTVPVAFPGTATGAVALPPAERGRATYEAAVHLIDRDTARVIDL